ncbi:MAG TPA: O-antigen ligase family protein [Mycobacteriales bacterium]|nr:O-antigen ligase family protein [Mycobacteriales bacterium]
MTALTADSRPVRAALVAGPVLAALVVGAGVVRAPVLLTEAVVAGSLLTLLLLRLDLSLLLFVVVAPFEAYVTGVSGAAVKLTGLLVFAAWALRLLVVRDRRPLRHPAVAACAVFVLLALAATVAHPNGGTGVGVLVRYVSFAGAFVVVADAARDPRLGARLVRAFTLACAGAAVAGIYGFAVLRYDRARGPLEDPNDLAFFLVAAVPLAVALARSTRHRRWYGVVALLLAGIAATLSRGAVVALVVVVLWALAAGWLRPRTAALTSLVAVAAIVLLSVLVPALVESALTQKKAVASSNVSSRRLRWAAAGDMTLDSPLLGLGPAGFRLNYQRYQGGRDTTFVGGDVAHEMYLEVSSELGVPALVAFLLVLALPWRGSPPEYRGAMTGMGVAALFLTEQYFLPLWLVAGLMVAATAE